MLGGYVVVCVVLVLARGVKRSPNREKLAGTPTTLKTCQPVDASESTAIGTTSPTPGRKNSMIRLANELQTSRALKSKRRRSNLIYSLANHNLSHGQT